VRFCRLPHGLRQAGRAAVIVIDTSLIGDLFLTSERSRQVEQALRKDPA
jgi:hypothetical protein